MQTQWTDRYDRYPADVWYGAGGGKWEVGSGTMTLRVACNPTDQFTGLLDGLAG